MKTIIRIVIVGLICVINLSNNLLLAQSYEVTLEEGPGWTHVVDGNGVHWYGWEGDEGWEWDTDPGVPWPPDDDGGENELDGDNNGEHEDEDGWDDDWDDNHVDQDWDDWWDWWDDFWDLNGDEIDIDQDPSNGSQHGCPELMVLTVHPNGANNRMRTTVGIGEHFRVFVKNVCGGQANFEIFNFGTEGEILGGDVDYAEFRANFKPGTMTIKAKINGMSQDCSKCISDLEIVVTVIEPNEVRFNQINLCAGRHDYKRPSAGFHCNLYLYPETVNFYNVAVKERNPVDYNTCTGDYFSGIPCPKHTPSIVPWEFSTTVKPGFGTKATGGDEAYFALKCHKDAQNPDGIDAGLAGFVEWKIEYVYLRESSSGMEEVLFVTHTQTGRNYGSVPGQPTDMLFQVRKNNEVIATYLTDPEICPIILPDKRCH